MSEDRADDDIRDAVRRFLSRELLTGEEAEELDDATPLVSGGIVDSISTLKLVSFLEERFDIELEAHEVDAEHLDTLERIERLVESKRAAGGGR